MDDSRILHMLWHRMEAGIEAMQKTYGKRLMQTAMNILDNRQDAEEAVNDTYLAVWNTIPPASPMPLCAYVYRIGRNTALNHLRHRVAAKRDSRYDRSLDELHNILSEESWEQIFDTHALGQAIDGFLSTLSSDSRRLFLRRYWFGDEIRDLAREWKVSPGTLTVRLHRIRRKLKDYLIKEGFPV